MSVDILQTINEFESRGGELLCDGGKIEVSYPPTRKRELQPLLEILRANRDQVAEMIRELRPGQPTAECPRLPAGVKLIRYEPKSAPVAVAPVSIVTDVPRFIEFHLAELDARLNSPVQIRAGGSVYELLSKLAEVGLELELSVRPGLKIQPEARNVEA